MVKLDQSACRRLITDGEFPPEIRYAENRVAVVLTQSWCYQWGLMQRYLKTIADEPRVYYFEYDREPIFTELRDFKENVLGSERIPYIRYYVDGKLVNESHFVLTRKQFLKRFTVPAN